MMLIDSAVIGTAPSPTVDDRLGIGREVGARREHNLGRPDVGDPVRSPTLSAGAALIIPRVLIAALKRRHLSATNRHLAQLGKPIPAGSPR